MGLARVQSLYYSHLDHKLALPISIVASISIQNGSTCHPSGPAHIMSNSTCMVSQSLM